MTTTETPTTPATWDPPGAGEWEYDASHSPPAPTLFMRRISAESATVAYAEVMEESGAPLKTIEVAYVHGKMFRRLVPLVGGDSNMKPPPKPVLWAAARLHPAFRKRNKVALTTMADRTFMETIDSWADHERQWWIDANRQLQAVDLDALTDGALADHVDEVGRHTLAGWTRHHVLHGTDLGPIGDLLAHTNRWGLDPVAVMATLQGFSPATTEASALLSDVAAALADAGADLHTIDSLDDVRNASPQASALLDDYLEIYGYRVVTSYDIEAQSTIEMPAATLAALKGSAGHRDAPSDSDDDARVDALVAQLPPQHHQQFTQMIADARAAYGLRDDNGPLTAEWPMGLVRRAYLHAGQRLAEQGRFDRANDAFELDTHELAAMLRGTTVAPAEIQRRRDLRAWEAGLDVPATLGPTSAPPDPSILPAGLRRMTEAIVAAVSLLEPEPEAFGHLQGLGIGDEPYTGRARVAQRPEDVLASMEPGDVLVAAWTAPTYNTVLAAAGAIVVQEGGLLCHAAVMARELQIPAVIGVDAAMTAIADGDTVTVDPVAGLVTIH